MSRYVNLDEKVTAQFYDEEHEEWFVKEVTVEEILSICDSYTEVDAERVIRCKDCEYFDVKWQEDKFGFLKYENVCNLRGRDFITELNDYCSWAEEKEK